jgi:hypothetical protein
MAASVMMGMSLVGMDVVAHATLKQDTTALKAASIHRNFAKKSAGTEEIWGIMPVMMETYMMETAVPTFVGLKKAMHAQEEVALLKMSANLSVPRA